MLTILLIILGSIVYLTGLLTFPRWVKANTNIHVGPHPITKPSTLPLQRRSWEFDFYNILENCVQAIFFLLWPIFWLLIIMRVLEV